ncbi:polyisoprenoid-binding protein [Duganella radicis]|uniref:Polyisoprenoid-binding protein n=2 Tax=Duganella radicis TaxID=551988 RepID=A0A6L6PFZ7_9BURK|nr:polyisoprenoid-binding protein [Duganella radicis]
MLTLGGLSSPAALAAWELDPSHTHVGFQASHLGVTHTPGIFRKVEGNVMFDDAKVEASSVTIVIDAASIDTVNAQRDADLRTEAWFDVDKNPKITFVSTSVRRIDDKNYVISGNLTIRGKTRLVDFNTVLTNRVVNPFVKLPVVGFVGSARIKRSDFGMTQYLAMIANEVDLTITLELLQKP